MVSTDWVWSAPRYVSCLAHLVHERAHQPHGDVVGAVVAVPVGRELPLGAVAGNQARVVAERPYRRVLDRGEGVGDDRQPGDAAGHRAQHGIVVQRHLQPFVGILVVHVMDDVERVDVGLGEPVHHRVEPGHDVRVVEHVTGQRRQHGPDLGTADLVPAAIDRVQQRLSQVDPGAEELHLLADLHGRDAAGDRGVVPEPGRIRSSDSYWIELVSMETCAQNRLNGSGSAGDHSTVRFGSGAGPRL